MPAVVAVLALALSACSAGSVPPSGSGPQGRGQSAEAPAVASTGSGVTTAPSAATGPGGTASAQPGTEPGAQPQLPRGGRSIFPEHRLVGFSGYPGSPALGRMGIGVLADRVAEMDKLGRAYRAGRSRHLPVLELIATIVHGSPGKDGKYRGRASEDIVQAHLEAARAGRGLLLLNIQPGRSDFVTEVKHWEKYLVDPHVGVALDPEWRMGPGQVPMRVFGSVTGAELNAVAEYLSGLVKRHNLPEKVMVVHQLRLDIIKNEAALKRHPGVVAIKSVDGIGSPAMKVATWRTLTKNMNRVFHPGFKLFYQEDAEFGPIMKPKDVLAITPTPEYILYE
ncbi:MAG: hypothetical protein IPM90_12490 [Austwickia sp.]|nr:hypothetical protein [Austwickia sp.]